MRLDEPVVGRAADEQGRAMGNNQALQVEAEALSGLVGGALAMLAVKVSLVAFGGIAVLAALCSW